MIAKSKLGGGLLGTAGLAALGMALLGEPASGEPSSDILLTRIYPRISAEQYVAAIVGALRVADRDENGLDRRDLERAKLSRKAIARAQMISGLLVADLNGDFAVSKQELLETGVGDEANRLRQADGTVRRARPTSRGAHDPVSGHGLRKGLIVVRPFKT